MEKPTIQKEMEKEKEKEKKALEPMNFAEAVKNLAERYNRDVITTVREWDSYVKDKNTNLQQILLFALKDAKAMRREAITLLNMSSDKILTDKLDEIIRSVIFTMGPWILEKMSKYMPLSTYMDA